MDNNEKYNRKKKAFEKLEKLDLGFPKDFDPDAELREAYRERYGDIDNDESDHEE